MSWNDNLTYQENLDIFLESLKDYSKDETGEYKIVKKLTDRTQVIRMNVFRKQYSSVAKRVKKDMDNIHYKVTKELVSISYKDEVIFSFKPPRYLSISDLLRKIKRNINNKELQLRDYRDSMIITATDNNIVKKIEELRIDILGLYEKQNIIQNTFDNLNNTSKYTEELEEKNRKLREGRITQLDLHKQMKEFFQNKDIYNFQRVAKEIAILNITEIEKELADMRKSRDVLNNILIIRLPEIIENKEVVLKKKKTVKKNKPDVKGKKKEEGEIEPAPKKKKT